MKIIVQKFGGTSVRDDNGRKHALHHIKKSLAAGYKVVTVVSAMVVKVNHMQRIRY